MALGDPFGITYEGRYKAGTSLGEGLQKGAESFAEIKKKQYDPWTVYMMQSMGKDKSEVDKTPDDIKKEYIAANPQYQESDISVKPKYTTYKGVTKQEGWEPVVDEKARERRIAGEKEGRNIKLSAEDMLKTINEVEDGLKYFGATGDIPTLNPWDYERKNWESNVNKLLSGKVVELIMNMKSASKTGATGFGQLSDREGQLLRDASTALKRGLGQEDAKKYLDEMRTHLEQVVSGNHITLTSPSGKQHSWDVGDPEIAEAKKRGWK